MQENINGREVKIVRVPVSNKTIKKFIEPAYMVLWFRIDNTKWVGRAVRNWDRVEQKYTSKFCPYQSLAKKYPHLIRPPMSVRCDIELEIEAGAWICTSYTEQEAAEDAAKIESRLTRNSDFV